MERLLLSTSPVRKYESKKWALGYINWKWRLDALLTMTSSYRLQLRNHVKNAKVRSNRIKMKFALIMKRLRKERSLFLRKGSWDRRPHFGSSEEAKNSSNRISTMNDLPSPEGCWQKENVRKQIKNNSLLLGSALIMLWTIWIAKDIFPLQFNDPCYPLSKEDFALEK